MFLSSCGKAPQLPERLPCHIKTFMDQGIHEITISGLPAPFYRFTYLSPGYIASFTYASGINYNIRYAGDELHLMKDEQSGETLEYFYSQGRPVALTVTNKTGIIYRRASLTYNIQGQLQTFLWQVKPANEDFANDRALSFSYYTDGNLKELKYRYYAVGPQPAVEFSDTFDHYDNNRNCDDFTLLHLGQTTYPPVLLPAISLQKNNPAHMIRSGQAAVTYEINYQYKFDTDHRPVFKTGDLTYTGGNNNGQHETIKWVFSYFP